MPCLQLDGYSFHFVNSIGQPAIFLLPLLDLMNHASSGNAEVQQDSANGSFAAIALRDIRRAHAPLLLANATPRFLPSA